MTATLNASPTPLSPVGQRSQLSTLIGGLLAAYFLIGRWTLSRLQEEEAPSVLMEPRLWIIACLVPLTLLLYFTKRRDQQLRPPMYASVDPAVLLLLGYMMLTSMWAPITENLNNKLYEATLMLVAATCLFLSKFRADPASLQRGFWGGILLLGGLMAFAALASAGDGRVAAAGGGPNTLGRNMSFLIAASLLFAYQSKSSMKMLYWGLCVLAVLIIVLTGSRGALLSLTLGGMVYLLHQRGGKIRTILLIEVAAVCGWFIAERLGINDEIWAMFQERVLERTFGDGYVSGRDTLYTDAWDTAMAHFWTGIGLNGVLSVSWNYPHNVFLEVFAEGGLVGLLLLLNLLQILLRFHLRCREWVPSAILIGFVAQFTFCQTSGDLYDSRGLFLLGALSTMYTIPLARVNRPVRRPNPAVARVPARPVFRRAS